MILYEMRVGQPPFLAHNPADTQMKVCECGNVSEVVIKSSFSVNFIQFYSAKIITGLTVSQLLINLTRCLICDKSKVSKDL